MFYLGKGRKLEEHVQVRKNYRRLYQSIELLQEVWTTGLRDKVNDFLTLCPEEKSKTAKCSLPVIECLSNSKSFANSHVQLRLKRKLVTKASSDQVKIPFNKAIEVELSLGDQNLSLYLEDSCQAVYLPQRMYALEDTTPRKYSWWDNFNRHFFVDNSLVTIDEVKRWLKYDTEFKQGGEIFKDLPKEAGGESPALNLKYEEMLRYCAFHGKQLLSTVIFDAATMHPGDLSTDRMKFPLRSIWPWDYKKKTGIVWEMRSNKKEKVELQDCSKVFSSECLTVEGANSRAGVFTWSGLRFVMGGYLEVFRNSVFPKRNLKASSSYFQMKSRWHELGNRAWWDGNGFSIHNFNFRFEDPPSQFNSFGVAFRCAHEVLK